MGLQSDVMTAMKVAMKDKDQMALQALRAIKSEILLAQTSGSGAELTEADEIKILSKLVKQRKDSAEIFAQQNRSDLAEPELLQAEVISQFLPEQMSEEEVQGVITKIIDQVGANSMKDMGKVMGLANKELAGKTDGKTIAAIVKSKLA
ncbi:GatB/YqeY domain-containing protein [Winogradskyella aurantiaca]|uniref:GatB/YqeY domain-containing protein n=1 Tax=Winogradskyella aurantiaca TaxID=2219558 RepID=UPI000E1D999C|nr:GatB/YqeY domain-containing protein [Winogradskyella aurantiaca]